MSLGISIFTDGASRGNPGPGGWGGIVVRNSGGAKASDESGDMVKELGGAEKHTTNNRMEITAVVHALKYVFEISAIKPADKLTIFCDSQYVINGATKWLASWQAKNWVTSQKKPVLNRDLWEELADALEKITDGGIGVAESKGHLGVQSGTQITWRYVGGHSGIAGNERCDEIATAFADSLTEGSIGGEKLNTKPHLYDGPVEKYAVNVSGATALSGDEQKISQKSSAKKHSRAKAYSYVSFVDGKIERHTTWAECERRVKGVRGARYKKAVSEADEAAIMREFSR